jgi:hydroxymethylpyrimidine/phosphomethylpyrimidine kinase
MDLKTFASIQVWGMAVITALTAQNASKVSDTWEMEPDVVRRQILTLLQDIRPGAIKTGMLPDSGIIQAVADTIPSDIPLVIDPVMISTSGYRLIDEKAVRVLIDELFPKAFLVTPNIPEAEVLSGLSCIESEEEMTKAGERILDLGPEFVIVKGGHATGDESVELLVSRDNVVKLSSPRLSYNVHGSGCCFSAAITGFLARGMDINEVSAEAKRLVFRGINRAISGESGQRMINP